ncbi:MAG: Crp/Fnr family transcriptional regulator [Firmicutes bacterium]|nr:Crp/Fnr family transcriptional regulator [Bacillota bacterium]
MLQSYAPTLAKVTLFAGIDSADLTLMLGCLEPKLLSYQKNDFIAVAGEKFKSVGIMVEGEAVVIKENAAGNRVVMDLLKPGDIFGEVVVFAEDSVWPGSVVAQEASKALFIPRQKIIGQCHRICPRHREIIRNMLKIVSEKAMLLNKKVEYLTIKSMRGKISAYFLDQYRKFGQALFELPMNRNEMADFLNVSRPSMSREMGRMKEEGIIDFHLASVRIINLEALKKMVE